MNERESFMDLVMIIVNTFNAEKGLVHMNILLQLAYPLFQRGSKGINDKGANNANEDEEESTRKA